MTTKKFNPFARDCSAFSKCLGNFRPPEDLTVDEWADKYRVLPATTSAEAGPWRTSRTPYLREPMRAFTDPKIDHIVMVASSQVGKSEFELNIIGFIMMQDPGSILFIQPTEPDGKKFSRQRIAPMIRSCRQLRDRVADVKSRTGGNTIMQKMFPGGSLTITGSQAASALASMPVRYVIGDERDRWAVSAGTEGDPWELAKARQITFYNRKAVEVSTPTIKGASNIEDSYNSGTQERWMHKCPNCGEYNEINFETVIHEHVREIVNGKEVHKVTVEGHCCPDCGFTYPQSVMRQQDAKWVAEKPEAIATGCRSFWLTAFASPWVDWQNILLEVYRNIDKPEKLKVVYNTKLGKLWEQQDVEIKEDEMLTRREEYEAELPDGVLVLTCGVDTQDDRLEYEVVGWGRQGENWGIKKGYIMGKPSQEDVWKRLDDVVDHAYKFKNGQSLAISLTLVDSGGHYTREVYWQCRKRQPKRVFAIKGKGGDGVPLTGPPSHILIKGDKNSAQKAHCWLYILGVDAGKAAIYSQLTVLQPGAEYCHFPKGEERGYDGKYFNGLLSEKLVRKKSATGYKLAWEKLPGHERNEPLDCRNYAYAALRILDPDMDAVEARLKEQNQPKPQPATKPKNKPASKAPKKKIFDDW